MEILKDKVVIFKNNIDSEEWINLIEKVSETAYPLENVERRPHLTSVIPMVFDKKDNIFSLKLKSMFYTLTMPHIIDYMTCYNNFGIISKKDLIIISKLLDQNSMDCHNDSNDPKHIIAMLYLNDNYSGGEIFFRDLNLSYKPNVGDFIIYPGSLSHGVNKMTGNPRYSIGIGLLDPEHTKKEFAQI